MEREYYDFSEEWARNGEEIIPYSARLLGDSYKEWLENTYKGFAEYKHKNFFAVPTVSDNERKEMLTNLRQLIQNYI
jgi:hypothetical protein